MDQEHLDFVCKDAITYKKNISIPEQMRIYTQVATTHTRLDIGKHTVHALSVTTSFS